MRHLLIPTVFVLIAAAPAAAQPERGVTVYEDTGFRGQGHTFTEDVSTFEGRAIGNDDASSLRVDPGCRATLFKDARYRGTSYTVTEDVDDLRYTPIGNDALSSMRVECADERPGFYDGRRTSGDDDGRGRRPGQFDGNRRPGYYDEPGRGRERLGVTVYTDTGFRGRSETFYGGDRDPDLRDNPIRADRVSSVRVDPGCRVTLWEHNDYDGRSTLLTDDAPELDATGLGNDAASSLEVVCDRRPDGVTLFADSNYRGRSETFLEGDARLSDNHIRQDTASSVRIAPGCEVTLWEHADYQGRAVTLREDVPDLRATVLGNDIVSSLEVECRRFDRRRGERRRQ